MTETEMPQPNMPLIIDTFAHIELDRDHWNQATWGQTSDDGQRSPSRLGEPCGTSHCFAGWAVNLSGEQMVWIDSQWGFLGVEATVTGEDIGSAADRLLGIWGHSYSLYSSGNSLTRLYSTVAKLVGIKSSKLRDMVIVRLAEIVREEREQLDKMRAKYEPESSTADNAPTRQSAGETREGTG